MRAARRFSWRPAAASTPGDTLTLNLSGLPHHSNVVRDVGVGVRRHRARRRAVGWASLAKPSQGADAQLQQRREKLYADLVALEEQRRKGRIDDDRYATRRESLVAQLERVMGELDHDPVGA